MPRAPGSTPPSSLRARKKQLTARSIESAALGLFASRGFEPTTVEDIAAKAVVSPKTVRRYFGSKEAMVFFGPRCEFDATESLLWGRPSDEPVIDALDQAVRRLASAIEPDRRSFELRRGLINDVPTVAASYLHLLSTIGEAIRRYVADRCGVDGDDGDARLVAGGVVVALQVGIDLWLDGRAPDLAEAVSESLRTLVGPVIRSLEDRDRSGVAQ